MATSAGRFDSRGLAPVDEIDLLFGRSNPNPDRTGCPPPETIDALARRALPMDHQGYVHLTECSPCYEEFVGFLEDAGAGDVANPIKRRATRWAAVAAALLLVAAGTWYFTARHTPNIPSAPTVPSALRVELDLRPYAVTRSETNAPATTPLALSRRRLDLSLLLPVGSEAGGYDVHLLGSGPQAAASASGQAEIVNFVTTLRVALDLTNVPAGEYRLAVRRDGDAWSFYPATVR
jgi:hypothetical protein